MRHRKILVIAAIAVATLLSGCLQGIKVKPEPTGPLAERTQAPAPDQSDTTLLGFWKRKFSRMGKKPTQFAESSVDLAARYISENDLADMRIEWKSRDPKTEWERIQDNPHLGPIRRKMLGRLSWGLANLRWQFPGGGNHYDPFSDTLYLKNDEPIQVLTALARAKAARGSRFPVAGGLVSRAPLLAVGHRVRIASEVQSFARKHNDWDLERDSYRELYPSLLSGSEVAAVAFVPGIAMPIIRLGSLALGIAMAEAAIQARQLERETNAPMNPTGRSETNPTGALGHHLPAQGEASIAVSAGPPPSME